MTSYIQMKKRKKMEKYKKFMTENKKDFLLPHNLSPKEKDIFMHIFQLLRKKVNRGIYPEAYNNEIIYTKSDVKSLILKEIVLFKQYKKGWIITINPLYITKNVECLWCGAKFSEMVYFRQNSITCPVCGLRMHNSTTASTTAEKVDNHSIVEKVVINVPSGHVISDNSGNIKVTDIVLAPTAMERLKQIAYQEVIPFKTSKADKLNALSTLKRIENKKKEADALILQDNILANFSPICINFLKRYFFIQNHTLFSARMYINLKLSEISNDPQFIANASLKCNTLTEVKNACELLYENAIIRSVTIADD